MEEPETATQRPKSRRSYSQQQRKQRKVALTTPQQTQILPVISENIEEKQFWLAQSAKFQKILGVLEQVGTPYIRLNHNLPPQQVLQLVEMLQSKDQDEAGQLASQLISGFIEGYPRTTYYKLAVAVKSFLESHSLQYEFEWVHNLVVEISEMKDFGSQALQQAPFDIEKVFQLFGMAYDRSMFPPVVTGPQAFVIKDPCLLATWLPVKQVYTLKKLRRFIRRGKAILSEFLMNQSDFDLCSDLYVQLSKLKKEWCKDSPDRSLLSTPLCNTALPSASRSKSQVRSQLRQQRTINQFFKARPSDPQITVSEFDGSIFRQLDSLNRITPSLDEEGLRAFEQGLKSAPYSTCQQIPIMQPRPKRERTVKRKYYQLHNSVKELKGFMLTQPCSGISARNPFRKAETMDYDQDSEEDVQEYLAEVCDSMKSSTQESETVYSEDQEFIIQDQQLNQDLLSDYDMKMNYNQLHCQQVTSGDYNQYQFMHRETMSPELAIYFQRYQMVLIADKYPLPSKDEDDEPKLQRSQRKHGYLNNDENFVMMLLFVHGKKETKNALAADFKIHYPECSKNAFTTQFNDCFYKNDEAIYLIKQHMIEKYNLAEKLKRVIQESQKSELPTQVLPQPNAGSMNFLQVGTNLFAGLKTPSRRNSHQKLC